MNKLTKNWQKILVKFMIKNYSLRKQKSLYFIIELINLLK